MSKIEWTNATWNPVVGCTRASSGCDNCYAATMTRRLEAMGQKDYAGLTTKKHFNGMIRCLPKKLMIPLGWKKPRMVFVNSMSDLFHANVPFEFVDKVFGIMSLANKHTYQILTKRPERMVEYFSTRKPERPGKDTVPTQWLEYINHCPDEFTYNLTTRFKACGRDRHSGWPWPPDHIWLGTSVENQATADDRIPHLLVTPAAVRFLSVEPLLDCVDLGLRNWADIPRDDCRIDWVIVGGESGPRSRVCGLSWVRKIVADCKSARVPCFVKQLGAKPTDMVLKSRKGGDMAEWPADLRVREFPV